MDDFSELGEAVVLDTETTGLNSRTDRIVSVTAIQVDFSKGTVRPDPSVCRMFSEILDPQCPVPPDSTRIHGLRDRDVRGRRTFGDIASLLRDFIGNRPLVIHNSSFDRKFLNAEFSRTGVRTLARNRSYCTMRKFRYGMNGGRRKGTRLEDAAEALGLKGRRGRAHESREDAVMALRIAAEFAVMDRGGGDGPVRRRGSGGRRTLFWLCLCAGAVLAVFFV